MALEAGMAKGGKRRQGKVVTGGHHDWVEGLAGFLPTLEAWKEIETIRLTAVSMANRTTRGRRKTVLKERNQQRTGMGMGGGFMFRCQGWARIGETVVGIKCTASNGRSHQAVVLTSTNLEALWARLIKEGYLKPRE